MWRRWQLKQAAASARRAYSFRPASGRGKFLVRQATNMRITRMKSEDPLAYTASVQNLPYSKPVLLSIAEQCADLKGGSSRRAGTPESIYTEALLALAQSLMHWQGTVRDPCFFPFCFLSWSFFFFFFCQLMLLPGSIFTSCECLRSMVGNECALFRDAACCGALYIKAKLAHGTRNQF